MSLHKDKGCNRKFRLTLESAASSPEKSFSANALSGGDQGAFTVMGVFAKRAVRAGLLFILALFSSFALLLTGCGSSGSTSKSNSPSPSSSFISVGVSPTASSVHVSQAQSFTAMVTSDAQNKGVTWSLSGASCSGATCGTLSATSSASGAPITYRAPTSVPTPPKVSLTATSVSDNTRSASATITVAASNVSVILTPL